MASDFTSAIERIVVGLEKRNRRTNQREREIDLAIRPFGGSKWSGVGLENGP